LKAVTYNINHYDQRQRNPVINHTTQGTQQWLQIMLSATAESSDTISNVLTDVGALAVTFEDLGDNPVYEPLPGEQRLWEQTTVIGLFNADNDVNELLAKIKSTLKIDALPDCQIKYLEEKNWERVWLEHFKPMQFGEKLWVCPTSCTPPDPAAINLMLDPGLAFGTGTHATTAQCLATMSTLVFTDKLVLDYGCGSGILAIAAARLGADSVWAIDIDTQALTATTDNARRNDVENKIIAKLPEHLDGEITFDILLANILSGPLIELASTFAARLHSGGIIILSGILAEQADAIREHYEAWFRFAEHHEKDNWACLVATRR